MRATLTRAACSASTTASAAAAPSAANPEPTYLNAISAPPPAAGDVPSQTVPLVPPPFPSGAATAMAPVAQRGEASIPALPPVAVAATPLDSSASPRQQAVAATQAGLPPVSMSAAGGQASAFASAWADAHDKLTGGRYAEALAVLSAWYDDPTLGLEESQRLEELLGQLAGTVIYSQEDLLLPPHIVAPGDTLPSIAMTVGVPWQLLGKINGVDDPGSLLPGEALKMIRGPFDAVVSLSRRRLSLQLGGNYAGSFPVVIGRSLRDHSRQAARSLRRSGAQCAPRAPASLPRSLSAARDARRGL